MIALIQRVTQASVVVDQQTVGSIDTGILALIGVEQTDTDETTRQLATKILDYRIFPDDDGRMNHGLRAIEADLLLVPQFTLVADTRKGLRPGFSLGAAPQQAEELFNLLVSIVAGLYKQPETGRFGADMQVSLCNDGPVTFWLHTGPQG